MPFTSQLGGDDSQLGNIQIGGASLPVVVPDWFPAPRDPAGRPAETVVHTRRFVPTAYLATLSPVPIAWMPRPIRQKLDQGMPGEIIPPAHHIRRMMPLAYTIAQSQIAPATQLVNVPMVRRMPTAPRVLGGFTDLISSVFNSLTHSGQIIQTGPGAYKIIIAPQILHLAPQSQPATSPYYGTLWVDSAGHLHYLSPNGTDTTIGDAITGLTGDVSASGPGIVAATLASIITAGGPTGSATAVPVLTWDAKGRLTAVSSTSIQIAESQVTNLVTDLAGKQPLDADLTAIAALATTSFGRGGLTQADAASFRTYIGAGTGSGDALTSNPLSQFAATTSLQLKGVISDETGSGALVFATSPTLVTPVLGAATATSINGNTITAGTGTLTLSTFTLTVTATASIGGTHSGTSSGTNTGDQTITLTGGVTGSGTGSFAATVITNANLTGHITSVGNATVLGSFTSAQLATALTDETGSGAAVFATSPVLTTPNIGSATGSVSGNAGTVTVADAGGDTTTWPMLATSQTGSLAPATDAGLTYDATADLLRIGTGSDTPSLSYTKMYINDTGSVALGLKCTSNVEFSMFSDSGGSSGFGTRSNHACNIQANANNYIIISAATGITAMAFGATVNGAARVGGTIFNSYADGGNTTTSETDLVTNTTAAGSLATNADSFEAVYSGITVAHATATRQIRAYFGGTLFFDSTAQTTTAAEEWRLTVSVGRVSATVVRCSASLISKANTTWVQCSYLEITGLTLSSTNILKITGTAAAAGAATNDIVKKHSKVVWSAHA